MEQCPFSTTLSMEVFSRVWKLATLILDLFLQEEEDHPGPIFLRNVTTGHRPYKMIVAFVTVFIALMIIVVISVVYSNS